MAIIKEVWIALPIALSLPQAPGGGPPRMPDSTVAPSEACIVGWAHTPFGKLEEPDLEALLARVGRAGDVPFDVEDGEAALPALSR